MNIQFLWQMIIYITLGTSLCQCFIWIIYMAPHTCLTMFVMFFGPLKVLVATWDNMSVNLTTEASTTNATMTACVRKVSEEITVKLHSMCVVYHAVLQLYSMRYDLLISELWRYLQVDFVSFGIYILSFYSAADFAVNVILKLMYNSCSCTFKTCSSFFFKFL